MDQDKIELIRQFYSALNRNDADSALKLLDAQVLRIEFEGSPNGGSYKGHDELRAHIIKGRSTWAEGTCEPIDFYLNANRVVVMVHVKVRLKIESKWIDGRTTDGFAIEDGRIAEFHSFVSKEKAFGWAGLS